MSLCAACGLSLTGDVALCAHHSMAHGGDWAIDNRMMCDFLHRGKLPPRPLEHEREEDVAVHVDTSRGER